MRFDDNTLRVILGNEERKRTDVDLDWSALYWYGARLDYDDIVDYQGEIGIKVESFYHPDSVERVRWGLARKPGQIRRLLLTRKGS